MFAKVSSPAPYSFARRPDARQGGPQRLPERPGTSRADQAERRQSGAGTHTADRGVIATDGSAFMSALQHDALPTALAILMPRPTVSLWQPIVDVLWRGSNSPVSLARLHARGTCTPPPWRTTRHWCPGHNPRTGPSATCRAQDDPDALHRAAAYADGAQPCPRPSLSLARTRRPGIHVLRWCPRRQFSAPSPPAPEATPWRIQPLRLREQMWWPGPRPSNQTLHDPRPSPIVPNAVHDAKLKA